MRASSLVPLLAIVLAFASAAVAFPARASPIAPPAPLGDGSIGGPIIETAVDSNGNGLWDAVNLSVPVILNVTAHWQLSGDLGANGTSVYNASDFVAGPGNVMVTLSFAGWILRLSRWNGSFSGPLTLQDLNTSSSFTVNYTTAPYVWTQMELRAELADGYSTAQTVPNANGTYNYLEVTGRLHVGVPGRYYVTLYLYNSTGATQIAVGFNRSTYAIGFTDYHIWLDGNAIRQAGIDGPYQVDVWLCFSRDCLVPSQADSFLTPGYTAASFAHEPIALAGNVTDRGVDTNGNGKFEYLEIDIPVNVTIAGVYNVSSNLYAGATFLENGWASSYLPVGNQTMPLDFSGWFFRTNLEDGPFTVQLFLRENITTYTLAMTHTTAAYTWGEFDSPYGLLGPTTVAPVDTDGNGLYNVVYVNTTIDERVATSFQLQLTVQTVCCGSPSAADQTVTVTLPPGQIPVTLVVPGWILNAWRANGTYGFGLALRILPSSLFDDAKGVAMNFNWTEFDPPVALRNPVTMHPVDTDHDGLWNTLQVDLPLQVIVGGVYSFTIYASNSTCGSCGTSAYRELMLWPGPYDLNFSLSGLELRQFPGDADLRVIATLQGVGMVLWTGVYPIPDPSVFQSLPTQTVTFHLQAPVPLTCCTTLELVNYTNAFVIFFTGGSPDPLTFTKTIPVQNYTVFAVGVVGSSSIFENLSVVGVPLPGDIVLDLASVGLMDEATSVQFWNWSGVTVAHTRTLTANPGARLTADLSDQPDGVLTDSEIINLFLAWGLPPLPTAFVSLDGVNVSYNEAFPYSAAGAGPVVGGPDISYTETTGGPASPTSALVHVVGLNLSVPYLTANTSAEIRVPLGWTVSVVSAPAGSTVVGLETGDVQVTLPSSFLGTAFINATATWGLAPYRPAAILGTVVGTGGVRISGAAVTLWVGTNQVNATSTDAQGRFVFGSNAAGVYTVRVQAPGYAVIERNVAVDAVQALDIGTIQLIALPTKGDLRGQVVDTGGNSVAGATLQLLVGTQVVAAATSDSAGFFNISNVTAGSYQLLVNATGFESVSLNVTITAAQVADLGTITLQKLPTPPKTGLSWLPWASAATIAVVVGVLVVWRFLRNRRRPPSSEESTESPGSDEHSLK